MKTNTQIDDELVNLYYQLDKWLFGNTEQPK